MNEPARLNCAVVLVAAGSGERLGRGTPKAWVNLAGKPILAHCVETVRKSGVADALCAVIPESHPELRELCESLGLSWVAGGKDRAQSVRNALRALPPSEFVIIHDAARPLAPASIFQRIYSALQAGAEAVIPAVPVVDTIKEVETDRGGPIHERVGKTLDRSRLRAVQTPQGFRFEALRSAHALSDSAGLTDDAMAMEAAGYTVGIVPGSALSMKITTETDLLFAEALLAAGAATKTRREELS